LCNRLLDAIFDDAEELGGESKVNVKIYTGSNFLVRNTAAGLIASPQVVVIPKSVNHNGSNRYTKGKYGSKNSSITNSQVSHSSQNQLGYLSHLANDPQKAQAVINAQAVISTQPSGGHNIQQVQSTITSSVVKPHVPIKTKSTHAIQFDEFTKGYLVSSPEYNVLIETNYNSSSPYEHKSGNMYSISLIFKGTGNANIGKEFSFAKVFGNGNPGSFSLPLLKPQVQRTISVTMDFDGSEDFSYWAVKRNQNEWIGTVVCITINKSQNKLTINCSDYSKALKDMERHNWILA
jgi:hypothetical protein